MSAYLLSLQQLLIVRRPLVVAAVLCRCRQTPDEQHLCHLHRHFFFVKARLPKLLLHGMRMHAYTHSSPLSCKPHKLAQLG